MDKEEEQVIAAEKRVSDRYAGVGEASTFQTVSSPSTSEDPPENAGQVLPDARSDAEQQPERQAYGLGGRADGEEKVQNAAFEPEVDYASAPDEIGLDGLGATDLSRGGLGQKQVAAMERPEAQPQAAMAASQIYKAPRAPVVANAGKATASPRFQYNPQSKRIEYT